MNDLFSEFAAAFNPAPTPKPEKKLSNSEQYIKDRNEVIANESAIQPSKEFEELTETKMDFVGEDVAVHHEEQYHTVPEVFNTVIDVINNFPPKPVKEPNYDSMPLGLKEAQERNGIRDHGLRIMKPTKGDFVFNALGWVVFVPSESGVFTIADPDNINEATKNFLDRKYPNIPYVGTGRDTVYIRKEIVETDLSSSDELLLGNMPNVSGKGLFETINDLPTIPYYTPEKFTIESLDDEIKGFEVEEVLFSSNSETVKIAVPVEKPKPKFGRAKFAKKLLAEGEVAPDKRKIKAVKKTQDGIEFDSTLELYMYNLLKDNNIRFDMKVSYSLQEAFTYRHEVIRPMIVTPDFILIDYPVIIETKGFANERVPMQYKMLKHKLHNEGREMNIVMPSNQKQCREVVDGVLHGFKLSEPLTEHAATARKNKLKKAGFEWVDGYWIKGDSKHLAHWIMQLPNFDFIELLIASKPKEVEPHDAEKAFLIYNACVAHEKNYDYETMRYSDYMYDKIELMDQVWEYVEEINEIGTKAFKEKHKGYNTYYI